MKLACMGDIHSNYKAFESCLHHLEGQGYDGILITGDLVSDCPYPQKTLQLLAQAQQHYPVFCVRGNREEYLLAHHETPDENWQDSSQFGSLLYTYENLTAQDFVFFEALPLYHDLTFTGLPGLRLCHGSPSDTRDSLLPRSEATHRALQALPGAALICGHTHDPFHYTRHDKHLIKAGSVGMPVNGQIKAQFTCLNIKEESFHSEVVSVQYDIDAILHSFATSGLTEKAPIWSLAVSRLLQTGRNYPLECLLLAKKKARREARAKEEFIPETYWRQAACDLGLFESF